ncbi:hypothetical protein [Mesorhizobium sp. WSM3859]|uniref:ATP-dependent DNA ligase n=1 Tax=Mesorhizobium sp. WSM3859 TaxID=2029402 RepID=UPI001FDF1091|nr:hypothetical protein [Mesorhizobium sp. WSM3859]
MESGQARAFTRRGYDWSHLYKRIVETAANLPVKSAILDGEAVVLGKTGLPDFQALERELGSPNSSKIMFFAFDLLHLNGRDLRRQPLIERKAALQSLLQEMAPTLRQTSGSQRIPIASGSLALSARHLPTLSAVFLDN